MRDRPTIPSSPRDTPSRCPLALLGLVAAMSVLAFFGCGRSTASQDAANASPPPGSITLPLAARLKSIPSCATDLLASVIVDGNESNRIGLVVDCAAGTVSGTITGLSPGSHTFELRFTLLAENGSALREILIARTEKTGGDIAAGKNTEVAFAPGALIFPDDDHDGWTNLAEVTAGTNYLSAADAPQSSARRKSANYAIADSLGLVPAVGPASGGPYTDSVGGPINR